MDHTSRVSPLKERASIQLAVNFCQSNSFKEVALHLEKPTYGCFLPDESAFVSDQKEYSIWTAKQKELPPYQRHTGYWFVREQKDAAVEKECQRLIEKLPGLLRDRVRVWINRIALEYLSYMSRIEASFGVSRYFLMAIFSIGDWKETGRLDEEKVALRLLEDERLTVFQKYQIACVYCLHVHIPELWKRLTRDEVSFITKDLNWFRYKIRSGELTSYGGYEMHISVLLWSYQMDLVEKDKLTESELWIHAASLATYYGNRAALALCWERLNEQTRQQIVIEMALIAVKECGIMCTWNVYGCEAKELPFSPRMTAAFAAKLAKNYNLRPYYGELVLFFLSQMNEEQKLTFFQRSIGVTHYNVLKCFLDWPLQHELLPTINRLWEMITKDQYIGCLYTLMGECSESSSKENNVDDYRSLFWKLWETTPQEFKLFVFHHDIGPMVLYFLLMIGSFRKDDEALFKQSFRDQTAISKVMHNRIGEEFCSKLLDEENLSFLNWILEKCFSKEQIPTVKKNIIKSKPGCRSCVSKLADNRGNFVEDVIDWCFDTDSEKSQFKRNLIEPKNLDLPDPKADFAKVERVINFCVSSDEMKKEIMADFALYFCKTLLEKYESGKKGGISIMGATIWEQMDKILSWSLASDEKIRNIKKDLFENAINLHFKIVFDNAEWEEVERFYKWFDLSSVQIKDLKHTIFNPDLILKIQSYLLTAEVLVAPLRWCLTDEETVICFKKTLEEKLCGLEGSEAAKERLNYLVGELLCGFRVETQDETNRKGGLVKRTGEKRSVDTDDESSSSSKRFMKVKIENKG